MIMKSGVPTHVVLVDSRRGRVVQCRTLLVLKLMTVIGSDFDEEDGKIGLESSLGAMK